MTHAMNTINKNHDIVLPPRLARAVRGRFARASLALWSFSESIIFPIPPDPALMLMALAQRRAAYRLAMLTTLTSVAGGVAGYAIGAFLLEGFLTIRDTDEASLFGDAVALYHEYGVLMVFLGGFTPIPYKVITIFSGAVGLDFVWFVVMSLVSRGLRFYLEAFFVRRWGAAAWHLAVYWLGWRTAIAITFLAIGGIIVYKLM